MTLSQPHAGERLGELLWKVFVGTVVCKRREKMEEFSVERLQDFRSIHFFENLKSFGLGAF